MSRRPVWILHVFVVGLALHNFVMAELWRPALRGNALELVSAWKEALLALGLLLVCARAARCASARARRLARARLRRLRRRLRPPPAAPARRRRDPPRASLLGVREDLLPVACYFFGRGLALTPRDLRRLGATILAPPAASPLFGLVDIYAIPLSWWRELGRRRLVLRPARLHYRPLRPAPELHLQHRQRPPLPAARLDLPLAARELLHARAALLLAAAWRLQLRPRLAALAADRRAPLRRPALDALALAPTSRSRSGSLVYRRSARRHWRLSLSSPRPWSSSSASPSSRPTRTSRRRRASRRASSRPGQRARSPGAGPAVSGNGLSDASITSHWRSLRAGVEQVSTIPRASAPATPARPRRGRTSIRAGESTYTELGVDAGLAGGLLFVAWSLALLRRLLRSSAWLAAAIAAMLALGLQTDIIGVPWLVYVLWTLAGSASRRPARRRCGARAAGGGAAASAILPRGVTASLRAAAAAAAALALAAARRGGARRADRRGQRQRAARPDQVGWFYPTMAAEGLQLDTLDAALGRHAADPIPTRRR